MIVIDMDKEDDIVLMSTKDGWRMHMRDARVAEFECNENVESLGGWKHMSMKIQAGDIIRQKIGDTSKDKEKVPKFFVENDNPFIFFDDIKRAVTRSKSEEEEEIVYLPPITPINDKRLVYMPDEMLPPKVISLKGEITLS